MTSSPSYAGIGSRETPDDMLTFMGWAAGILARRGWVVRSGGADGADTAFEMASPRDQQEIYLPWAGFNQRTTGIVVKSLPFERRQRAESMAKSIHPASGNVALWNKIGALMTRNVFQVLGLHLNQPVSFVLCWAPKPKLDATGRCVDASGGTGAAIRLAASLNIPVYNLAHPPHLELIQARLAAWDLDDQFKARVLSPAPSSRRL